MVSQCGSKQIARTLLAALTLSVSLAATANELVDDIAQTPLFLDNVDVSGNLALVPSVEWPTINSVANIDPTYSPDTEFVGYFDSDKCYEYIYHTDESERRFEPSGDASGRECNGEWSGNFLNWVATQTVDPFRKALTGGYRVRDTATTTWLEKARHDGQGGEGIYPRRRLPETGNDSSIVRGATPFDANWIRFRVDGLDNRLRFHIQNNDVNSGTPYNPAQDAAGGTNWTDQAYDVTVRVSVCDDSVGLESNCVQYDDGWKPEGLIQENAANIRYSVTGYLNDHDSQRDGGVLRARKKYVGPLMPVPGEGLVTNPNAEWDANTGVQFRNPDPDDADATSDAFNITIEDSGVINYINKFGQMTDKNHKSTDPVSELFYAAIRYMRGLTDVSSYSSMAGIPVNQRYDYADGFPVITDWEDLDDPVQFMCQPNVALGIGDVYTHRDKNLPGNNLYRSDEPSMPPEVAADDWINVISATNFVGQLEGIGNIGNNNSWTGRENSAYMAGLAYLANAGDLRPDMDGRQSMSTYWVDVLENQILEAPSRNQFFLATKYGGFDVPADFDPFDNDLDELEESWWHTNNETLVAFGGANAGAEFERPDNYFLAGAAGQMVGALEEAFSRIISEMESNVAAVAVNSTRLDTDTVVFQAGFESSNWSGNLEAYDLDDPSEPAWQAAVTLNDQQSWQRNILTYRPDLEDARPFTWGNLSNDQREALNHSAGNVRDERSDDRVEWLRGEEGLAGFRSRTDINDNTNLLGDIINSDPQYVGRPNFGYALLQDGPESSYSAFRATEQYRNRPNAVYVGANDGRLYGFDADSGEEYFSYIPGALLEPEPERDHSPLSRLMETRYEHRYFVDGTPTVSDAFVDGAWRTLLVGTIGGGGRAVFLIDVTDPSAVDDESVRWEFTHENLGYGVTNASLVRLYNERWAVVFGNGYGGDSGESSLFFVDAETGELIREVRTGAGDQDNPNGMAAPYLTGWPERNRIASRAYAGDLEGNLWRLDLHGNPGNWAVDRVFQATAPDDGGPQPITSQAVGLPHPYISDTLILSFGTGSYFRRSDAGSVQVQTFYGLFDSDGSELDNDELQVQRIIWQEEDYEIGPDGETLVYAALRATSEGDAGDHGWRFELDYDDTNVGERVVSRPSVITSPGRYGVRFTTLIPDVDPCGTGRFGYVMELDMLSGSRPSRPVFDLDGDGQFDDEDTVTIPDPDDPNSTIEVPVSGVGGVSQGESLTTVQDEDGVEHIIQPIDPDGDGDPSPGMLGDPGTVGRIGWEQLR